MRWGRTRTAGIFLSGRRCPHERASVTLGRSPRRRPCVGGHGVRVSARDDLLLRLQQGLSIERRPFAALAKEVGVSEDEAIATVRRMLADGSARRFGAVFDARRLGYRSVLCAVDVPAGDIDRVGARVSPHPGVTHCYERGCPPESATVADPGADGDRLPNLWFTLAVPAPAFENGVAQLRDAVAPYVLRPLPALRRFKIDVIFEKRFPVCRPRLRRRRTTTR